MKIKACLYIALQKSYGFVLRSVEACISVDFAKKLDARLRFRRKIDLRNPKTLADKVSYISLHTLPEQAVRCTDKWEARDYVAKKGLEHILIPVHGEAVSSADELDFSIFPNKFVLKATHGCRMNYICLDKDKLDREKCRKLVRKWLNSTYGTYSVEPHYRGIPHRVYCETCIAKPEELQDYKIFCMNGEPRFVLVCSDRIAVAGKGTSLSLYLYDISWNPLDGVVKYRGEGPGDGVIPKPLKLDEMLDVARKLSKDFDFVRVDLYEVDGEVYFGELTFTPFNGTLPILSQEFLEKEGEKLILSKR